MLYVYLNTGCNKIKLKDSSNLLKMEDNQIERYLDSESSESDTEIDVFLMKDINKRKLSKKAPHQKHSETTVDSNTSPIFLDEFCLARNTVKDKKNFLNCKSHRKDFYIELEDDNKISELKLMHRRICILSHIFPEYVYTCSILSKCECKNRAVKSLLKNDSSKLQEQKCNNGMCCLEKQKITSQCDFKNWSKSNDDSDENEREANPRISLDLPQTAESKFNENEQEHERTPTRKRKPQSNDDYEAKRIRNGSNTPSMKMKLKRVSRSGHSNWKVSESEKKGSPKNKEETPSKNSSSHDLSIKSKTPTKLSAKKNLFSIERSSEHTNDQLPSNLTKTPNKEQNYSNNQGSPAKNKSNYCSTPKKIINSNNTYELKNKTPTKQNEDNETLNSKLLESDDENFQSGFNASPGKSARSNSKHISDNDKLDDHQFKTRTPLKEIESSPSRRRRFSSDIKSVKMVTKDLNGSTPIKFGSITVSSSHDICCADIENQELSVNSTATPVKEAISQNVKQYHSSSKITPVKKLANESSPCSQYNLHRSPADWMKSGLLKDSIVKLDKMVLDKNNLTNRSMLNTESPSKHAVLKKLTPRKTQQDKTNQLSPLNHVQLKKCASPLKNREITVTTPVSKKKERRGFLTPSMAKRTQETIDRDDNALDMTRKQLHISTVPKSLPCRDAEFSQIKSFLSRKIEHSAGGCMYISGVPGTGKTATVHAVIRALQENVKEGNLSEFDFVEVNGLRLTEPRQAYVRIYQALTNQKLTPDQAQQLLNKRFSGSCKKSTIILVDELDYLCNRRQDVVYNILDWPSKRSSALVVLTISNTMDLPERTLKGRVTSRMGLTRLTFQPYTHHQLKEIVEDRLCGSTTFHPDAIQLVARKVAAVSGDARRALDICRRTTELVHDCGEQITVNHVEEALIQLCTGARVQVIKSLSGLGLLVLRSVRDVCQRTGVDETTAASVFKHMRQLTVLEGGDVPSTGALLQSCVSLVGLGLLVAEKGRVDLTRKMSLNVSSDDIHYALDNITV